MHVICDLLQEVMEMVSEQSDLYDVFGRIASTLEWTVTYAGACHAACT